MGADRVKVLEIECEQCLEIFTHEIEGSGRIPKRCLRCRTRDPKGRETDYRKRKERARLVARCTPGDSDKVDYIMGNLGVSQGEAVRTAIRVYHALLIAQQKR
jgi:hypothetical protein